MNDKVTKKPAKKVAKKAVKKRANQAEKVAKRAAEGVAKLKGRMGRPTMWTPELEDAVIEVIETTGSQLAAAQACGIHSARIHERELVSDAFRARVARARQIGYAARAEQAVIDAKEAQDAGLGRLAFDADRWWLSKIDPRRYGDKLAIGGADDLPPVKTTIDATKLSDDALKELLRARRDPADEG